MRWVQAEQDAGRPVPGLLLWSRWRPKRVCGCVGQGPELSGEEVEKQGVCGVGECLEPCRLGRP